MSRMICLMLLTSSIALAEQGIPSTVRLRVSDDAGSLVTNAAVDGCFLDLSQSGARDRFNGVTDTNGVFVAKGEAVLGVYARLTCTGYYPTTEKQTIEYKRRQDGKGYERIDRWDIEIRVLLKRIRNPIPMYTKGVENIEMRKKSNDKMGHYMLSSFVGYDLVKGNMVPPYGRGEVADVGFNWKMTIYATNKVGRALEYDTLCEIRMTNVVDGICKGKPDGSEDGQSGSSYFSGYEAPAEGYTNAISFYRNVRGTKADSNDDRHYLYYFRIRTRTNEMGQVTNALYGQIHGQINGQFTYYLNPTPNDRNIEFDPKRNLFKEAKEKAEKDKSKP